MILQKIYTANTVKCALTPNTLAVYTGNYDISLTLEKLIILCQVVAKEHCFGCWGSKYVDVKNCICHQIHFN